MSSPSPGSPSAAKATGLPVLNAAPPAARAAAPRWRNPYRHLPRVRWVVQLAYVAFLVAVGVQFWRFYSEVIWVDAGRTSRPPAVEAFLPISALVGLKRLWATGSWDDVHPAGLVILLAAIGVSLAARKAFCGWVCPVGTFSRALEWVGSRTLWRRRRPMVPRWLDLPLASIKHLLLAFFAWIILVEMPVEAIDAFMHGQYNVAADAKMLLFFQELSGAGAIALLALVLLSIVVKNAWCRYACPYGALLGVASLLSPQRVVRDPETCNDCRACTRACPAEIPVHARRSVWTSECVGCMSCVAACTVPDCLTSTRRAKRALSPWLVPATALGFLLGAWLVARATGHWRTEVPREVFSEAYRAAPRLSH